MSSFSSSSSSSTSTATVEVSSSFGTLTDIFHHQQREIQTEKKDETTTSTTIVNQYVGGIEQVQQLLHQAKGKRQGQWRRSYAVGDLVAVFQPKLKQSSLSSKSSPPPLHATATDYIIGQIVALWVQSHHRTSTKSSISSAGDSSKSQTITPALEPAQPVPQFFAAVRHLLPWHAATPILNTGEQNLIQSHCRGKHVHALLETYDVSTLNLSQHNNIIDARIVVELNHNKNKNSTIDAASSCVRLGMHPVILPPSATTSTSTSTTKTTSDPPPATLQQPKKYLWTFDQVYGRFSRDGSLALFNRLSLNNDWNQYYYHPHYYHYNCNNTHCPTTQLQPVPPPLMRGWAALLHQSKHDYDHDQEQGGYEDPAGIEMLIQVLQSKWVSPPGSYSSIDDWLADMPPQQLQLQPPMSKPYPFSSSQQSKSPSQGKTAKAAGIGTKKKTKKRPSTPYAQTKAQAQAQALAPPEKKTKPHTLKKTKTVTITTTTQPPQTTTHTTSQTQSQPQQKKSSTKRARPLSPPRSFSSAQSPTMGTVSVSDSSVIMIDGDDDDNHDHGNDASTATTTIPAAAASMAAPAKSKKPVNVNMNVNVIVWAQSPVLKIMTKENTSSTRTSTRPPSLLPQQFFTHVRVEHPHLCEFWASNLSVTTTTTTIKSKKKKSRSTSKGESAPVLQPTHLSIHVGETVIIADEERLAGGKSNNNKNDDHDRKRSRSRSDSSSWFPLTRPWYVAQILSIYQRRNNDGDADADAVDHDHDHDHTSTRLDGNKDGDKEEDVEVVFGGSWFAEVRWFYRPRELTELNVPPPPPLPSNNDARKYTLVEVDETVDTVPISCVVGRARLSSSFSDDSFALGVSFDAEGILTISFLCQHIHLRKYDDASIRDIYDWEYPLTRLVGPLSRGLMCEKAYPGQSRIQSKRLQRIYKEFMIQRYKFEPTELDYNVLGLLTNSNAHEDKLSVCPVLNNKERYQWPDGLLDSLAHVGDTRKQHVLGQSNGREFFPYILIPTLNSKLCDPRMPATKSKSLMQPWKVTVGDCICLAYEHDKASPTPPGVSKNPWHPFRGPWKIVQVVSMYSESDAKTLDSRILLEVRGFLRPEEVPSSSKYQLPALCDDEVVETDIVERGVCASRIIGRSITRGFQHHDSLDAALDHANETMIPEIKRRTRFMFLDCNQGFYPIFSKSIHDWKKAMIERGLRCSCLLQDDRALADDVKRFLDLDVHVHSQGSVLECLFAASLLTRRAGPKPLGNGLFLSVPVIPQWDAFLRQDLLCSAHDRSDLQWIVSVGDVVAVRIEAGDIKRDQANFPFATAWKPCQVLAIQNDSIHGPTEINVRVLSVRCARDESIRSATILDDQSPWEKSAFEAIDSSALLGPVTLTIDATKPCSDDWGPVFLPLIVLQYESTCRLSSQEMLASMVSRGVQNCGNYREDEKSRILRLLGVSSDASDDSVQPDTRAFLTSTQDGICRADEVGDCTETPIPIHQDVASGINFYFQLKVSTRCDAFVDFNDSQSPCKRPSNWNVKLGDVVAVQYAPKTNARKKADMLPFSVPWSAAEVVTIYNYSAEDDPKVEIRWFYRPSEIRRSNKGGKKKQSDDTTIIQDVFESDHFDNVDSTQLLAPVVLVDDSGHCDLEAKNIFGDAALQFVCCEFWSVKRKSLIPSGSLNQRVERGRRISPFFGKYSALQQVCAELDCNSMSALSTPLSPKEAPDESPEITPEEAYQNVIDKLSLTDASKEAMHESGIIGRETERGVISVFLRAAIGDSNNNEFPSSALFVAGPPGAGKTVCVRACVNELRRNPSSLAADAAHRNSGGKSAATTTSAIAATALDFDFCHLNGMELRHPHDVYSRLWEDVSPDHERCPNKVAASRLEQYFTTSTNVDLSATASKKGRVTKSFLKTNTSSNSLHRRRRVVVLLVDEVDFLFTKKQTVLCDLFDWPLRSTRMRRLVVIGVSNTLNLPERLHPRIQSRIGSNRLFFKSYNHTEICKILRTKINQASPNYPVFQEDAITYVSKKIGASSGDIRKAFRICRAAVEMILKNSTTAITANTSTTASTSAASVVDREPHDDVDDDPPTLPNPLPQVSIQDVSTVSQDSVHSMQTKGVAVCCSPYEALFLVALAHLNEWWTGRSCHYYSNVRGGGEDDDNDPHDSHYFSRRNWFDVEELLTKMHGMAHALGDEQYLPPPNLDECLFIMSNLAAMHLIDLFTPTPSITTKTSRSRSRAISQQRKRTTNKEDRMYSGEDGMDLCGVGGPWPLIRSRLDDKALVPAFKNTTNRELAQKYLLHFH